MTISFCYRRILHHVQLFLSATQLTYNVRIGKADAPHNVCCVLSSTHTAAWSSSLPSAMFEKKFFQDERCQKMWLPDSCCKQQTVWLMWRTAVPGSSAQVQFCDSPFLISSSNRGKAESTRGEAGKTQSWLLLWPFTPFWLRVWQDTESFFSKEKSWICKDIFLLSNKYNFCYKYDLIM